jgi:FkbM family methyltransferase
LEIVRQPWGRLNVFLDSYLCRLIYLGQYEPTERHCLNAFLREGDVFVDVGANIGLYAVIAAKIVGSSGKVYAFEPCSSSLERLSGNVQLNGYCNVSCHQLALSDSAGDVFLNVSLDGFDAWNSLSSQSLGGQTSVETVRAATWDAIGTSICAGAQVTMMKIDIEGWESRFLAGARNSLAAERAPVLQFEFNDTAAKAAGSSGREVYQTLCELGYRLWSYDHSERSLKPEPIRDHYGYVNLIAAKNPAFVINRLRQGAVSPWIR